MKNEIKKIIKNNIPKTYLIFIQNNILGKPFNQKIKNLLKVLFAPVIKKIYLKRLDKIINSISVAPKINLYTLFNGISDDFWFWIYTKGYTYQPKLHQILPSMPEERLQLQFTGISGYETLEQAFSFYRLLKTSIVKQGLTIKSNSKILDFGCGWGRITRFFLKDLPESNIYGIDCDEYIIKVSQNSNFNCNFETNDIYPPTNFKDDTFDLIFSYSVFSHLSEDAHRKWLIEFRRILKPGGILFVTTRDRNFIISCSKIREIENNEIPFFATGTANSFLDTEKCLKEYDSGNYLYSGVGGGGIRDSSFYGETCIPKKYSDKEWIKYFRYTDYIFSYDHRCFNQNVIIAKK